MNSLIDEYRQKVPNDPRSDDELMVMFGKAHATDGRYAAYKDFVEQIQSQNQPPDVPMAAEFRHGMSSGMDQLAQTGVGLGALAANVFGADSLRDTLLKKSRDWQVSSDEQNPTAVPRVEDVHDLGSAAHFALNQGGRLLPQLAEALLTGAAGAAAGTAAGPEGTAIGGVAGFIGRRAARAVVKESVESAIERYGLKELAATADKALVEGQLKRIAGNEAVEGALQPLTSELLKRSAQSVTGEYGSLGATLANFYGIGAGNIFGETANLPGVDPNDAQAAALVGGVGSAIANAPLPMMVVNRFLRGAAPTAFKGVATNEAVEYLKRVATEFSKEVPVAATSQLASELVNIAAEKYSDPSKRDTPLDDKDYSRLLNAAVVGGAAGAALSPISAIPRGHAHAAAVEAAEATPPVFPQELSSRYWPSLTDDRKLQLQSLVTRHELGTSTADDTAAWRTLNPHDNNYVAAFQNLSAEQRNQETSTTSQGGDRNGSQKEVQDGEVLKSNVELAAAATNPNPTPAQAASGRYQKGRFDIGGMQVEIETPRGELRQNKEGGEPWQVVMPDHYGQIIGTKGRDGDPLDIFIGENPKSDRVWVIDQIDPETGNFDEHKIMFGFDSPDEAVKAYKGAFSDGSGKKRIGQITEMTREGFDAWVKSGDTTKALGYTKPKTAESAPSKPTPVKKSPAAAETTTPAAAAASTTEHTFGDIGALKGKKVVFKDVVNGETEPVQSKSADAYLRKQYNLLKLLKDCIGGVA